MREEGSSISQILADQSDLTTKILSSNVRVGERLQWELLHDCELAAGDAAYSDIWRFILSGVQKLQQTI